MSYLKEKDLYGVQFKDIVNQYIVVENKNLQDFTSKLGIQNTNIIPDKIENTNLNYEEVKQIFNKYLNIVIEVIPENSYSKIEKDNISLDDKTVQADGYRINLNGKEVQIILTRILETAKNDEHIFNLLNNNNAITFSDYQNNIQKLLDNILRLELLNKENTDFITINVYKQGKDTVKLSINIIEENTMGMTLSIEKTSKGLMVKCTSANTEAIRQYKINMAITKTLNSQEQENFECVLTDKSNSVGTELLKFNIGRNGALTSNNVTFNISIPIISGEESAKIEFKNSSNFSAVLEAESFTENNHVVINQIPAEQLNNLFSNLGIKISEKLKHEVIVSKIMLMNKLLNDVRSATNEIDSVVSNETDLLSGTTGNMSSMLRDTFNSQFEVFRNERAGTQVNALIKAVNESNSTDNKHQIIVEREKGINNIVSTERYIVTLYYATDDTIGYTTENRLYI